MKLEDAVYECLHRSPSLFYYKGHPTLSDFELSRLAVLEHLFLTNGNGLAWVDGYLVDCELAEGLEFEWPLGYTAEGPAYGELKHEDRTWPPERNAEFPMFAYEFGYVKNRGNWPFSIYPISSNSAALPDFIRPDWLHGLKDVAEFALQYFGDPHSLDGSSKPISMETRMKSIEILEDWLADINRRLSDVGKQE